MPTLATGETLSHRLMVKKTKGFTLLEMLLVLVIIVIMVAAGVRMTSPGSLTSLAKEQGQWLVKKLSLLCEKSLFENRHLALEFSQQGQQFLEHTGVDWQVLEDELMRPLMVESDLAWSLFLKDRRQTFEPSFQSKPHIICYPSGQLSAFDVRITAESDEQISVYQVTSTGSDRVEQGWFDG